MPDSALDHHTTIAEYIIVTAQFDKFTSAQIFISGWIKTELIWGRAERGVILFLLHKHRRFGKRIGVADMIEMHM